MPTKQAKHQQLQEEEQKKMKQAKGEQEKKAATAAIYRNAKKISTHTKCLKWDKSEPATVNDRDRTIRHSHTGL